MKSEGLDFLQGPDASETLELCGEAAVSFWVAGKLLCHRLRRISEFVLARSPF